jgi:hypothetical protein
MAMPGEAGSTLAIANAGVSSGFSHNNASTFRPAARASVETTADLKTLLASTTFRVTKSLRSSTGCFIVSALTRLNATTNLRAHIPFAII